MSQEERTPPHPVTFQKKETTCGEKWRTMPSAESGHVCCEERAKDVNSSISPAS